MGKYIGPTRRVLISHLISRENAQQCYVFYDNLPGGGTPISNINFNIYLIFGLRHVEGSLKWVVVTLTIICPVFVRTPRSSVTFSCCPTPFGIILILCQNIDLIIWNAKRAAEGNTIDELTVELSLKGSDYIGFREQLNARLTLKTRATLGNR